MKINYFILGVIFGIFVINDQSIAAKEKNITTANKTQNKKNFNNIKLKNKELNSSKDFSNATNPLGGGRSVSEKNVEEPNANTTPAAPIIQAP